MARLVFLGCMAYLVVGLGQLVVGAVMEPMVNAYGVHYGDGGQLVMHQFLGGLLGVLMAPWLIRKIGKKGMLLTALGLMVIIEFVYTLQPAWGIMLTVAPLVGMGFGMTEATVGAFIIGSAGKNANVAMSRVEVSFGAGALIMPFVGAMFIKVGDWVAAFAFVGVLSVITLLLWVLFWPKILDTPAEEIAGSAGEVKASTMRRSRMVLILGSCAIFFMIYVGFEMSFVHYLPSLLVQDYALSDSTAALSLSVFWGAMVIGRMVSGHAADRWGSKTYMLVTCVSAALLFAVMAGVSNVTGTFVLTFLAGLAMSGMFAVALVFANRAVPGMTEKTTSLLLAFGLIGGAIMPKLTGWFLDEYGVDATKWLLAGFGILMLAVIVWVMSVSRSKSAKAGQGLAA
ncbi:MAG: MFS transporter [Candidatus Cohnella colombiensis]|uniref:MFS transporter n=1 Tax=Candidatus Cohnella colombiensis TaxID=3121368 RepID=A0AA95EVQ8_9BACL|nr:MAG: MFS transporter [Cohnella sp.]